MSPQCSAREYEPVLSNTREFSVGRCRREVESPIFANITPLLSTLTLDNNITPLLSTWTLDNNYNITAVHPDISR